MRLPEYIPYITYSGEKHVADFQSAVDTVWQKAIEDFDDFLLQLSPVTATWGLKFYENEYGIKVNEKKPIEERRSHLLAKMRGVGTTTVEMVKRIADSFYNGEIEVEEHNSGYWFEVKFISDVGIPPNLQDFYAVIEEVKPAHLGIEYYILYNIHQYLSAYTHRELRHYTHEELRKRKLDHVPLNTHNHISKYTHDRLKEYTHNQVTEDI